MAGLRSSHPDATRRTVAIDVEGLASDLRARVRGEVRFDAGRRALYATDSSNYRQVPIGVVVPLDVNDVIETVAACRRHGAPVLSRGAGTSLAGQSCNVAVVVDMSRQLNRVLELDAGNRRARVQPGTVLDDLRRAAERHGLTFGPDPATHAYCTLGGMIGNNSCGVHSVMAGRTADNVLELDVLTYGGLRLRVGETSSDELERIVNEGGARGRIYQQLVDLRDRYAPLIRERYPAIPRRVSGYNLDELLPDRGFQVARALVGTEGTCVTVLEATVRLVPSPPFRSLVVLGYPDVATAADHVPDLMRHGPIALEGLDDRLVDAMRKKGLHTEQLGRLPQGGGWLLVEFGGGSEAEAAESARAAVRALGARDGFPDASVVLDRASQHEMWMIRESGLGASANVPGMPDTWEGWEDSAVPPERLGGYLRDLRALLDRHGYGCALYGHFGDGCVHVRIDFDLVTREGIERYRAFIEEAAGLVVQYGGSLSGEHGDGQSRAALLPKMYGEDLVRAFREFKAIWDPEGGMNPGKVVEPYDPTENLRLGEDYRPLPVTTTFRFPEDRGSFARAALRCVGVGKCLRLDGGTMCPSYKVTREEEHSTRGRARLLFEMLRDGPLSGGWKSRAVKEALDLCLACKACRSECPVNVDMASYKAEFLSHYYRGRIRPRSAYAMGWIHWWARGAARAPRLANVLTQTPGVSDAVKWIGGIAPRRQLPPFAGETFQRWFFRRGARNPGGEPVVLWPDTFTNHFEPRIARAAVEVLEAAGFRIEVPARSLCCGRPLYDHGFLDLAKRLLERILSALRPAIERGVPIVGLEPSCVAVFRDELSNLFPDDDLARRLGAQTFTLSELLQRKGSAWQPPALRRKALVQGHCQHRAVMTLRDEEALLERLGLDYDVLDSSCCGMAGSFGFERGEHYEVSIRCGERVLLPAVRAAAEETLIIANGFSCREQIAQTTDRRALHLAEVIRMALQEDRPGPAGARSERDDLDR